jgi:hypothetical protein
MADEILIPARRGCCWFNFGWVWKVDSESETMSGEIALVGEQTSLLYDIHAMIWSPIHVRVLTWRDTNNTTHRCFPTCRNYHFWNTSVLGNNEETNWYEFAKNPDHTIRKKGYLAFQRIHICNHEGPLKATTTRTRQNHCLQPMWRETNNDTWP